MPKTSNLFNEDKAIQVAGLLLKLNNGEMDMLKLVKLIYNIDREALLRWFRPITFDEFFSLDNGQIVSKICDYTKFKNRTLANKWNNYFTTVQTAPKEFSVKIKTGHNIEYKKLSRGEIKLIREWYEKYKDKTPIEMIREHHNQNLTPEYREPPKNSRIKTDYDFVLSSFSKEEDEIEFFRKDIEEIKQIDSLIA